MAEIRDIVIECRHAASLARFWAGALDGYDVAPYDEQERQRLRALGIDDPEDDPSVLVDGPPGRPRLWFQTVPEPKVTKNRVHLDIAAADLEAELGRLLALGASRADPPSAQRGLIVLRDPEGNEFCLVRL